MKPRDLIRELEPLTHDARMRRMVEYGRAATTDATIAATLDTLERGAFYERFLAMRSCFGSRDGARALRGLHDPSRVIRGLAIILVPLLCDDAQVAAALTNVPRDQRLRLLRRLRRQGRTAPVDAFVTERAEAADPHLAALLPLASEPVLRRFLEPGLRLAGEADLRRIARRHPDLIAGTLLERIEQAGDAPEPRLLAWVNAVLPVLAGSRPEGALALVRALAGRFSLTHFALQRLADRRPVEVVDLILAQDDPAPVRLDGVAHRLDRARLAALLARHDNTIADPARWLRRLAPSDRAAIFASFGPGWRNHDGAVAPRLVAPLPADRRSAEARRHLNLPTLAARPALRLPYAAFLPWPEARAAIDPYLRDPDADLRGVALAALIETVRFGRTRADEALRVVRARRNEQDPVRQAMLRALAALPPAVWQPEHLDDLGGVLRDALDAADLSPASTNAAQSLLLRVLPLHPAWAARWLATWAQERGITLPGGIPGGLSPTMAAAIAPVLLPVLQQWRARERDVPLIAIARAFGRRLRDFDGLVALVEAVVADTRNPWTADWGLETLARYRHERLAGLVPALVRADRSWIIRPVVRDYLHRRRQDLLTPFLGRRAYRGRFSTGRTRYLLPFGEGFHRWTARQQAVFAETLAEVAADRERDTASVQRAIAQLAALPAVPPATLIALANDDREAIRTSALHALGRLDGDAGVPALLTAIADERAPVAIYVVRRALLAMAPERALALLRAVPIERVTVAKEAVRLYGDLDSEDAYQTLLALDAQDLHPDVRAALVRALWNHLEREQTWPVLERAAASAEPSIVAVLARIPVDRLSPRAERRVAALLATLLRGPEPRLRLAVLHRCGTLPLTEEGRALLLPELMRLLTALSPDERAAAAGALVTLADTADAAAIGAAAVRIIDHRRALVTLVQALQNAAGRRRRLLPVVRAVLNALAADPQTAALRIELAIRVLPWAEVAAMIRAFAADGLLHADTLAAGRRALEAARLRPDAADLAALEVSLAADDDERIRRLGLTALTVAAAPPRNWSEGYLARLRAYRADRSLLVAAAARFILPGEELDPDEQSPR